MALDYATREVPADYKCTVCGATGCKLWREPNRGETLRCAQCACEEEGKNFADLGEDGRHQTPHGASCEIGWHVPAVPTTNGYGYWGFTNIPQAGYDWWEALPNVV